MTTELTDTDVRPTEGAPDSEGHEAVKADTPYTTKYKTKEETERGIAEADKTIGRLNNTLQEKQALLEKVLEKMSQQAAPEKAEKPTGPDKEQIEEFRTLLRDKPDAIMDVLPRWLQEVEESAKRESLAKVSTLEKAIGELKEQMAMNVPEHLPYREDAKVLAEKYKIGMAEALELAKEMSGRIAAAQSHRDDPPGTMGGGTTPKGGDQVDSGDPVVNDRLRGEFPGVTDKQWSDLNRKWAKSKAGATR